MTVEIKKKKLKEPGISEKLEEIDLKITLILNKLLAGEKDER